MGYYTRVTGEIYVDPPISWKDAHDTIWAQQGQRGEELTLDLRSESESVEIDGELVEVVRREFTHVRPTYDDAYKAYYTERNLQTLVDAFPGHEWSGYLEGEGEGEGDGKPDLWRLYVRNGQVVKVEPQIVWPEV